MKRIITIEHYIVNDFNPKLRLAMNDFLLLAKYRPNVCNKSVLSELLFPSNPNSWLSRKINSIGNIAFLKAYLQTMGNTLSVLHIPIDADGNHPLHYAFMSSSISVHDFKNILEIIIRHHCDLDFDTEYSSALINPRSFVLLFIEKYGSFTRLYSEYLQQPLSTSLNKIIADWMKTRATPCDVTKKYDLLCGLTGYDTEAHDVDSEQTYVLEIIESFFTLKHSSCDIYRFMHHCPYLLTKIMFWSQKIMHLSTNDQLDPEYLPIYTPQGLECISFKDPSICKSYFNLHAKFFPNVHLQHLSKPANAISNLDNRQSSNQAKKRISAYYASESLSDDEPPTKRPANKQIVASIYSNTDVVNTPTVNANNISLQPSSSNLSGLWKIKKGFVNCDYSRNLARACIFSDALQSRYESAIANVDAYNESTESQKPDNLSGAA